MTSSTPTGSEPDANRAFEGRLRRWGERRGVRLGAAVALGCATGIAGVAGGTAGVILAALIAIPFSVACIATIAGESAVFGAIVGFLGVLSVITVHHSPDVTAFEVVVLIPAAVVLWTRRRELLSCLGRERTVLLFVIASLGMLVLGTLYAVWQPIHLRHSAAPKELGKSIEVALVSLAVFAYVRTGRDLARVYAVLVAVVLAAVVHPLITNGGHSFSVDSLMTEAPLLFLILALPWARHLSVAVVASIAGVVLVVARTRGAWLAAVAIVALVLVHPRVRAFLGRKGIAAVGLAGLGLVAAVLSISSTRARIDSLVSGHDQSVNTRWTMIRAAAIEAERHPWTGVGPGEFKHWMLVHGSPVSFRIGLAVIPKDPHNVFAKFAAEMGLPGLALIVLWTVAVISCPWIAWRRRSRAAEDVLPYLVGLWLYAPVYLMFLVISEWGSLTRVRLALGAGLFLCLLRVLPRPVEEGEPSL